MKKITRRSFMKGTLAVGAALTLPHAQVLGANDDIRVAIIGLGIKGGGHVKDFDRLSGVRVAAICDPDEKRIATQAKYFQDQNKKIDTYIDLRKIIEDKNIDAVVTASPNHWHALITVWACQAGKDVYVEKPASHNIWEGRKMVTAARKYNRIVQTGTQNRSDVGFRKGVSYIQQGHLGKILWAYGLWYNRRGSIGKVKGPQSIPDHIHYNLWTGPAPLGPLLRQNLHYDWHWQWPTGSGDMGNLGAHQVDDCRWAVGHSTLPDRVMSFGGRFGVDDDGQTPNTQVAIFDYPKIPFIVEMRNLPSKKGSTAMDHYRGIRAGNIIQCEHGYFAGGRGGGWAYDNKGKRIKQFKGDGGGGHQANFIQAVRSRKKETLHAEIQEGQMSATLCHLANISYRIGHPADKEKILPKVQENLQALQACQSMFDHLAANQINLESTPVRLGPWLKLNSDFERFVTLENSRNEIQIANALLKRSYRKPFIIPDEI